MAADSKITAEPLLIDTKTAARMLGISRGFLYERIGQDSFPIHPVRIGTKILYHRKKIEAWIACDCPRTLDVFEQMQRQRGQRV